MDEYSPAVLSYFPHDEVISTTSPTRNSNRDASVVGVMWGRCAVERLLIAVRVQKGSSDRALVSLLILSGNPGGKMDNKKDGYNDGHCYNVWG